MLQKALVQEGGSPSGRVACDNGRGFRPAAEPWGHLGVSSRTQAALWCTEELVPVEHDPETSA
jgi:hypothetical protein